MRVRLPIQMKTSAEKNDSVQRSLHKRSSLWHKSFGKKYRLADNFMKVKNCEKVFVLALSDIQ